MFTLITRIFSSPSFSQSQKKDGALLCLSTTDRHSVLLSGMVLRLGRPWNQNLKVGGLDTF